MINPDPKPERFRSKAYLAWLRKQQPVAIGLGPTETHHVKLFGNGGMSLKPPDNDALPIPWSVHQRIGYAGEKTVLLGEHGFTEKQLRILADRFYERWERVVK